MTDPFAKPDPSAAPPAPVGYPPAPAGYPPAPAGYPVAPAGMIGTQKSIGKSILFFIITLGIYGYVWTFKTHEELKRYSGSGLGGGVGLVIFFFVSPVTFFLIPNEINATITREGGRSSVSTTTGFWYFLPIIGWFIWFSKVQGELNGFWGSKGAPAP